MNHLFYTKLRRSNHSIITIRLRATSAVFSMYIFIYIILYIINHFYRYFSTKNNVTLSFSNYSNQYSCLQHIIFCLQTANYVYQHVDYFFVNYIVNNIHVVHFRAMEFAGININRMRNERKKVEREEIFIHIHHIVA